MELAVYLGNHLLQSLVFQILSWRQSFYLDSGVPYTSEFTNPIPIPIPATMAGTVLGHMTSSATRPKRSNLALSHSPFPPPAPDMGIQDQSKGFPNLPFLRRTPGKKEQQLLRPLTWRKGKEIWTANTTFQLQTTFFKKKSISPRKIHSRDIFHSSKVRQVKGKLWDLDHKKVTTNFSVTLDESDYLYFGK